MARKFVEKVWIPLSLEYLSPCRFHFPNKANKSKLIRMEMSEWLVGKHESIKL